MYKNHTWLQSFFRFFFVLKVAKFNDQNLSLSNDLKWKGEVQKTHGRERVNKGINKSKNEL